MALTNRYPDSEIVLTRNELVWRGVLTPAEYSNTYEVVISHNLRQAPIVYVARPRLDVVPGKQLPHVFTLNTLCLHTLSRSWIAARLLGDTVVPWVSEWLFFYELWLATGGVWLGEGVHPSTTPRGTRRPAKQKADELKRRKLERLVEALRLVYDPTREELDELLHNTSV